MLMAAHSVLAQASSPVRCTGHSYLVSPSGLLRQRDSWCQWGNRSAIPVRRTLVLWQCQRSSEFLPVASCFLSLLFDETASQPSCFWMSSDFSGGLCQRSIVVLWQIVQTERFHKVWCMWHKTCVAGKTQGHLGLILLLLFNLKHMRKELPLETARKTHEIQHGNYLNLLHITRLSKHKLSYNNFHTMNEAP